MPRDGYHRRIVAVSAPPAPHHRLPERARRGRGRLVAGLLGAALVAGCAPSNLADAIRAGGENNATICARVTTVYGTLTYMRSNVEIGGDVSCDTLTIKTAYPPPAPVSATIPMAITPTFTVTPVQPLPTAPQAVGPAPPATVPRMRLTPTPIPPPQPPKP